MEHFESIGFVKKLKKLSYLLTKFFIIKKDTLLGNVTSNRFSP